MTDNQDMNSRIRRAAGRADPRELAAEAIAAAERVGNVSELRERIAQEAGLPTGMADRLRGDDAGALADDAAALAEALDLRPERSPRQELNDAIRGRAGRAPAASPDHLGDRPGGDDTVSLDGGVRGVRAPAPEPSMNALMRSSVDDKRRRIAEGARDYDDLTN